MKRLAIILAASLLFTTAAVDSRAADTVSFEYIAHAAFRITAPSGERLLIDPFASRVWIGYDFPEGIETDAVLITHPHYDHDGGVSRDHSPPWHESISPLREPGTYEIGGVELFGVAGKHADPYGKEFGQTNTIWVLNIAGLRIAHIGDNGPISDDAAAQIGQVDVLMMPIDSQYHILKEHEIQSILVQLGPRILIPMHYRLANLEPDPDEPDDLGGIDGWLAGKDNVRRLATHQTALSADDLPREMEILVFEHSPLMKRPEGDD